MSDRVSMRKVREVLRLRFECGRRQREIGRSCGIASGTVSDYLKRAHAAELTWEMVKSLSDSELEARLFRRPVRATGGERAAIDLGWVHQELKRPSVTLQRPWFSQKANAWKLQVSTSHKGGKRRIRRGTSS